MSKFINSISWNLVQPQHDRFYAKIFNPINLYKAFQEASKSCPDSPEVTELNMNIQEFVCALSQKFYDGSWMPGKCIEFTVHERKTRRIIAPPFVDRVVHHALCDAIEPIFDKSFIWHSYSCRKNKGIHAAAKALNKKIYEFKKKYPNPYAVQMDVHSFFPSLDHQYLLERLDKKLFFSLRTLSVLEKIIEGYMPGEKGIPIGSLTSQLFANVYMNEFDHLCTDIHKAPFYIRYADDFIVLCKNHEEASLWIKFLIDRLREIKLEHNPKSGIHPLKDGTDFCGFICHGTHIKPRKRNIQNLRRHLNELIVCKASPAAFRSLIASFKGYITTCDSWKLIGQLYEEYPILHNIISLKDMREK